MRAHKSPPDDASVFEKQVDSRRHVLVIATRPTRPKLRLFVPLVPHLRKFRGLRHGFRPKKMPLYA
jgi:hypothetical protein